MPLYVIISINARMIPCWIIIFAILILYHNFMKKLLIILIVFLILNLNTTNAENLNNYSLDDFACNYYERIITEVKQLIEDEDFYNAQSEIEQLYNSKCRTNEVAGLYLHVLYKTKQYCNAYKVASENDLLETPDGLMTQANMSIVQKDSTQARSVYDNILIKSSYDRFAEMSLNQNYISTGFELSGLNELAKLDKNYDTDFLKAKAYYNIELYEDAVRILKQMPQTDEVLQLQHEINRKRAYQLAFGYELYIQKLSEEFKLDVNKIAYSNSVYHKNMQVYLDYIMYLYTSGRLPGQGYEPHNNFTNEIRLGTQGRINKNFALKGDLGVKIFQDRGAMLLTDSWVKYYPNDNFNIKLGFHRNNTEQTFLSAVGVMIDNKFTGQIADSNLYVDSTLRLPYRSYFFNKTGIGLREGYNISDNLYWESLIGVGKLLRYDLSKPYLQKIALNIVSYNSGYQKNLENIYDSQGFLYGGYFSPIWYSDNTISLTLAGRANNKFSYGCGSFAGAQYSHKPTNSMFIWGASVFGKYKFSEHFSAELQYRYYKYANVVRNQLLFDVVISIFKK